MGTAVRVSMARGAGVPGIDRKYSGVCARTIWSTISGVMTTAPWGDPSMIAVGLCGSTVTAVRPDGGLSAPALATTTHNAAPANILAHERLP
jgi:hypothetical protein